MIAIAISRLKGIVAEDTVNSRFSKTERKDRKMKSWSRSALSESSTVVEVSLGPSKLSTLDLLSFALQAVGSFVE
jgi:hypothetical protein